MIGVTLKQFRYFEALAQQGHFGRAAELCSISQPALSMQIKDLEEMLGTPLFERSARQVRLTHFGEDFAKRVRPILRAVDELSELANAPQGTLSGRLKIGVIPTIAPYLLPGILARFRDSHSTLDIHVRETLTSKLIEELSDGRIDAAIVALPVSEPQFTEVDLFKEDFVFVRPSTEAGRPVPDGQALRQMRLLLLEEGHCFRDQALSFCEVGPTVTRAGLDGSSLATLVQMVGAGLGVTVIPEMAVPVETRSAPVDVATFEVPRPSRTIGMIWRKTSPMTEQFMQVAEVVRQAAETLTGRS